MRAAREAGLETVPVVVRDFDDRTALEVSLVENLAREDLGAADEARALMRLAREFGLSHEQIALRIGKSRPYVSNTIRLLDLPDAVLQMLERGELTSGQVRPLLSLETPSAQIAAAREIAARGNFGARRGRDVPPIARPKRGLHQHARPMFISKPWWTAFNARSSARCEWSGAGARRPVAWR